MANVDRKFCIEKKLLLFERLLSDSGHDDVGLVKDIAKGFDFTGTLPSSHSFKQKFRPASISCPELRRASDLGREALLKTISSSGDKELDRLLYEATLTEREKGYLLGRIDVNELFEGATLTKRFAVRQKNKVRPIDDYKASMVNSSVVQSEGVTVHTIDHIAAMISVWFRLSESKADSSLVAKCWDLSDAYKQVPLSDEAFELDSYLAVYDPISNEPHRLFEDLFGNMEGWSSPAQIDVVVLFRRFSLRVHL